MELSLDVSDIADPGIEAGGRGFGVIDAIVEEGDCPTEFTEITRTL